jgi:hypothetical protein
MRKNFEYLKIELLHHLKQKELSKHYFSKKKHSSLRFIIRFILNIFKKLLDFSKNIFLIFKYTFLQIILKKSKNSILVIVDEKKVDQISNLLIYKILKEKNISFSIINKSRNNILLRDKINQREFKYETFFSIDVFIKCLINIVFFLKDYILFLKKNNFDCINFFYLAKVYLRTIYDFNIINKINNNFSPDFIYINQNSLPHQNIINSFKNINNKIQIIGNSFNGLKLSNQILTMEYLWNNIDHLFCYGQIDFDEFNKKKKNKKYLFPPKNIYKVGSPRDYIFLKKKKLKKNITKFIKILFIKSNPNMQHNVDEKALKLLLKTIKNHKFRDKIILTIKDRAQPIQQSNIDEIKKNYSENIIIVKSEKDLTEKLIYENDLILGTYSTSFIYQSIFFKKPIIQILGNKIYWANLRKENLIVCNNNYELNKQITKFCSSEKKFIDSYKKKIFKLRCKLFENGNLENKLKKRLYKILL